MISFNILMMLKKLNKIIFIAGGLSGFFLTILFKKIFNIKISNQINLELNPFDIIVLIVNIFLAIYITSTLGKKIDSEKNEKQYLINYLQEFRMEFSKSLQTLIDNDDFDSDTAIIKIKYLRQKSALIIKLLRSNKILHENDSDAMHIRPKMSLIWTFFTNEENHKAERIQKINSLRNEIEEIIFEIIFKVNRK